MKCDMKEKKEMHKESHKKESSEKSSKMHHGAHHHEGARVAIKAKMASSHSHKAK